MSPRYCNPTVSLLASVLLELVVPIACAPVHTGVEPSYVPEPNTRGTFGLLLSCTLTYGFCLWTAVHPDIVVLDSFRHQFYHRMLWLLCALIFPELLLVLALNQLRSARYLRKCWNRKFPDNLGLEGAFFILMGGYTIEQTDIQESNFTVCIQEGNSPADIQQANSTADIQQANSTADIQQTNSTASTQGTNSTTRNKSGVRIVLQAKGFIQLMDRIGSEPTYIPSKDAELHPLRRILHRLRLSSSKDEHRPSVYSEVDKEKKENLDQLIAGFGENPFDRNRILDKCKADSLSKAIVGFQAVWFLLNCLARKLNGLPSTLIEFQVVVQIFYAVLIYGCWWYKPLDITQPISLKPPPLFGFLSATSGGEPTAFPSNDNSDNFPFRREVDIQPAD